MNICKLFAESRRGGLAFVAGGLLLGTVCLWQDSLANVTLDGFDIQTEGQSVKIQLKTNARAQYATENKDGVFSVTLKDTRLSPEQMKNGLPVVLDNENRFIGRAVPVGDNQVKIILPNLPSDQYSVSVVQPSKSAGAIGARVKPIKVEKPTKSPEKKQLTALKKPPVHSAAAVGLLANTASSSTVAKPRVIAQSAAASSPVASPRVIATSSGSQFEALANKIQASAKASAAMSANQDGRLRIAPSAHGGAPGSSSASSAVSSANKPQPVVSSAYTGGGGYAGIQPRFNPNPMSPSPYAFPWANPYGVYGGPSPFEPRNTSMVRPPSRAGASVSGARRWLVAPAHRVQDRTQQTNTSPAETTSPSILTELETPEFAALSMLSHPSSSVAYAVPTAMHRLLRYTLPTPSDLPTPQKLQQILQSPESQQTTALVAGFDFSPYWSWLSGLLTAVGAFVALAVLLVGVVVTARWALRWGLWAQPVRPLDASTLKEPAVVQAGSKTSGPKAFGIPPGVAAEIDEIRLAERQRKSVSTSFNEWSARGIAPQREDSSLVNATQYLLHSPRSVSEAVRRSVSSRYGVDGARTTQKMA
ncbi:MAG: hypothetical protein SFZ03_01615 [Candidatus Melainabacteria bacterium]|nr:hypothetical protein [Candidatus Melainabacteria bacterium]